MNAGYLTVTSDLREIAIKRLFKCIKMTIKSIVVTVKKINNFLIKSVYSILHISFK